MNYFKAWKLLRLLRRGPLVFAGLFNGSQYYYVNEIAHWEGA